MLAPNAVTVQYSLGVFDNKQELHAYVYAHTGALKRNAGFQGKQK